MQKWIQIYVPNVKKAFTLVELLVVIAVISVLMAILMPALAGGRDQARRIYCISNLRQMAIAAHLYSNSNDDYYPIAHYSVLTSSVVSEYNWDFTKIRDISTGEIEIAPGVLWQGQTIEKIHQCPSFKGQSTISSNPFSGYNYNTSYIGHGEEEQTSTNYFGEITSIQVEILPGVFIAKEIVKPARTIMVKRPARCALFGDGGLVDNSGDVNRFMRAPWQWDGDTNNSLKAAGLQAYRHRAMTNVAWADGHAGSQKEYYTETVPPEKTKIEQHNRNYKIKVGFLSPDNSAYDLK